MKTYMRPMLEIASLVTRQAAPPGSTPIAHIRTCALAYIGFGMHRGSGQMAYMNRGRRFWPLAMLVVVGAVVGSAIGQVLSSALPEMARSVIIGFDIGEINIADIVLFHLGLRVSINAAGALGMLLGVFLAWRWS